MKRKYGTYVLQKNCDAVTVPRPIRKHLGIESGDHLFWVIDDYDRVILRRAVIKLAR